MRNIFNWLLRPRLLLFFLLELLVAMAKKSPLTGRRGLRSCLGVALGLSLGLASAVVAQSQQPPPITKDQADAILKELQTIRQLLEQMQRQQQPLRPAPPLAPPAKVKVRSDGPYRLGKEDAPVTVVEFTDYQCPFCRRFHQSAFEEIKKNYIDTGKVRFVSRDFPLDIHPNAARAAHAARCAGEQGKFWEMRHLLIAHADKLAPEAVTGYAQDLGLDTAALAACIESKKFEADIQKDVAEADAAGITGTPTFVIGKTAKGEFEGFRLVGAQSYAAFDARLRELLGEPALTAPAGSPPAHATPPKTP